MFRETFGMAPRAAASAPGRVNLIGEHTDYNGGPVLPIAIAPRASVAVGPAAAGVLEAVSASHLRPVRVRWQEELPRGWAAYLAGVLRELWTAEALPATLGVRLAIASDVPAGAGLASSSALTVAATRAVLALARATLTPRQIAGIAFRAEHDHVGVDCGVMDQAIAALARPRHALLLEAASLAATQIPFRARLLLVDTGTRPGLRAGALALRRAECEAAVQRLKVDLPELTWLASWPAEWLARLKRSLREPVRSRAVHVVSETARTRYAAELLGRGRLRQFGALLYESHESCRRLYQCSTDELDTIVAAAKRAGALGARLTGAGWGGAAIVLLGSGDGGSGKGKRIAEQIRVAFRKAHGREPAIAVISAGGGMRAERM
ncbi:MAG: galactokinase [Gemmatimonadales bacterium]